MERPIYKELKTDMELLAAALSQVRVRVETESELGVDIIVDYGGPVRIYTPEFVKIQDTYYSRAIHTFKATKA